MPTITSDQAVALAKSFLDTKRRASPTGPLSSVRHSTSSEKGAGRYRVEFAYAGLPVKQKTTPPRDHPTVVFVDDESGVCQLMMWM